MSTAAATALYVHVPFCARKCRYCDFFSVAGHDELIDPYLDALQGELRKRKANLDIRTIYVGGGTPTSLATGQLNRLLGMFADVLDLSGLVEFTVEANPGTLDLDKLAMMKKNGVNRLSLGVQSLNDRLLQTLGRIHTAEQSIEAINQARETGFENVSIDLIFAIPEECIEDLKRDLDGAVALKVEHISAYGLTFEEGTPLWEDLQEGRVARVKEETELEMYRTVGSTLASAGFEHYEVSNYAQPSRRSIHNQVYWRNDPYMGIGPGAVSYQSGSRLTNVRDVGRYIQLVKAQGDATGERERLEPRKRAGEAAMLGLRRIEGIDEQEFAARTGFALQELAGEAFGRLVEMGLVKREKGRVQLTERGMEVADSVVEEFL